MKGFVLLGMGMVLWAAGCGDDDPRGAMADAARADAATDATPPVVPGADAATDATPPVVPGADAATDATPPDAAGADAPTDTPPVTIPVATHAGTITLFDVRVRNLGGAGVDGHGVQIGISFVDVATNPAPVMEESPSAYDGCKLWQLTPAQVASAVGIDEGPIQVTATDGSPVFPPCVFAGPGIGYICPDTASSGAGGSFSSAGAPPGTSLFTPGGAATFGAEDVGRYLRLSATGVASLNTAFPILAISSPTSVVVATGAGVNLPLPGTATFITLAGVGPIPGATADTFFSNTEQLTVAKAAGPHFDAFPANTGFPGATGIGDGFTLGTANGKVLPTSIPTDGSAFTIGCDDQGSCGTALGTIVDIATTDTPIQGLSPFAFPSPMTKRVQIRCTKVGSTAITVPAQYSAYLARAMSGATRLRVQFIRTNQAGAQSSTPPNLTNIAGGHVEIGFVTPP